MDGNNSTLEFTLKSTVKLFPDQDNSNFLTNHDMDRVMNQLGKDEEKAKAAAGILLTAPGIPLLYYGEEIGMSGAKPDEKIRTPMQWTSEKGTGFTTGTPWESINADYEELNVARQTGDPASLLQTYRTLIHLRREHSALQTGDTYITDSNSNQLIAYLRSTPEENIRVGINLDDQPVTVTQLSLDSGPLAGAYTATSLLDDTKFNEVQANASGGFDAYAPLSEIPAHAVVIIQLARQ
jgi:glycosidase